MSSEWEDVCESSGFTANEDCESNRMLSQIEQTELRSVREDLDSEYGMSLSLLEIRELMEYHGLDFGFYNPDYTIADLLFTSIQEEDNGT